MVDFSLKRGSASCKSDIDLILQQIDILFDTTPTEVFGEEEYGTTYDRYLHQLKISNEALKQEVLSDLGNIQLFGYMPTVDIYLIQGTEDDIALIDINLSRDDETYNKTYRIS